MALIGCGQTLAQPQPLKLKVLLASVSCMWSPYSSKYHIQHLRPGCRCTSGVAQFSLSLVQFSPFFMWMSFSVAPVQLQFQLQLHRLDCHIALSIVQCTIHFFISSSVSSSPSLYIWDAFGRCSVANTITTNHNNHNNHNYQRQLQLQLPTTTTKLPPIQSQSHDVS